MSIVAIIGVIFAIVILVILVNLLLKGAARAGWPVDGFIVYAVWAIVTILCIFLIAYAFDIPIPFFHWR